MRILIDLRPLETGNRYRGFGYYIENLVKEIIKKKTEHLFEFLIYSSDNPLYVNGNNRFIVVSKPLIHPRLYWVRDQVLLTRIVKRIKPDIFLSLDTNLPFGLTIQNKIKTIVTIHDLIPLLFKNDYNLPFDRNLEYKVRYFTASRANTILTISNHSKSDIVKYLKINPNKISVVYEAVSSDFRPVSVNIQTKVRDQYTNGKPYLLTVGDYYGIDPRKNYHLAIRLLSNLQKESKYKGLGLIFVGKCGGKNNEYSKLQTLATKLNLTNKVVFTDFVSQAELIKLYSSALCYLHLSSYEGFGLPILQAMSCGTPVVAADNSSVSEVANGAASLFETNNQSSLQRAFIKTMANKNRLILSGIANANKFSWKDAANRILEVINKTI